MAAQQKKSKGNVFNLYKLVTERSDLSGCLRNQKLDVTCTASGYGQQDEPTETLQSEAKRSAHRSLTEEVQ